MKWFGRGKKGGKDEGSREPVIASNSAREEADLPLSDDAIWVKAQQHMDDRFLRLAAHSKNWQKHARIHQATNVVLVIAMTYIAIQWRVEPVFIAVDKLGRKEIVVVGVDNEARIRKEDMVYREMVDFIENVRTVTSDYGANNKALRKAFSRLTGAADTYVRNDLASHKPNEVAEKKTIAVEVKLAMPVTDGGKRNSWHVEWTETSYDLKGEVMGPPEVWKANIQYELHPGKTVEEVRKNQMGLYIPTISWAKQM